MIDPALSAWLGLAADVAVLKEHGVDSLTLLSESPVAAPDGAGPVVFVARPTPAAAAAIAATVKVGLAAPGGARREWRALLAPRAGLRARAALAAAGALGSVALADLPLHFLPLDADLLSLEDYDAPAALAAGHPGPAHAVAAGLAALLPRLGAPAVLRAVGPAALAAADALAAARKAAGADAPPPGGGKVSEWILIDRSIDWVTPLLTQLTYEGLIREALPVRGGAAVFEGGPAAAAPSTPHSSRPARTRVPLTAADPVFRELRDASFAAAGPALGARARAIQTGYSAARAGGAPLADLRDFAATLKTLPAVQRHVALAEAAGAAAGAGWFKDRVAAEQALLAGGAGGGDAGADAAEAILARGAPAEAGLRLLCLACAVGAAPTRARLDRAVRELAATAGPEVAATLTSLEHGGLLKSGGGGGGDKPAWPALRRSLRLLADGGDPRSPVDAAYVYAGYAPATVRLVEAAGGAPGWAGAGPADAVRALGGGREVALRTDAAGRPTEEPLPRGGAPPGPRIVLVAFIGGATSAEVAALRWLAARPRATTRYLVATSAMLTGDDVVRAFAPPSARALADALALAAE